MSSDPKHTDSSLLEPVADFDVTEIKALPFAYAKKQGVLLAEVENDHAKCVCREDVQPATLAEVRRFVGMPLNVEFCRYAP